MDSLNICWRGQPKSGKRQALHAALRALAEVRNIPFHIQQRQFFTGGISKSETGQISTTAEDDGGGADGGSEKDSFPYEFSLLHIGFDIARMSMQDKIYLKPILQRWGAGSQVLAGNQGRASRILVFYHAHLFSSESYFLLHSLLENTYGDLSLWFTSELPIAERLSDYFIEVPVSQVVLQSTSPSWHAIFQKVLTNWSQKPQPKLKETNEIRSFLYELLMRNLRWTDCVHYLLDVVLELDLLPQKKIRILSILASQEATAAGETIPSYRIPLLWELLFLQIRDAISAESVDGEQDPADSSGFEGTRRTCQTSHAETTTQVVARQPKSQGRQRLPKGGARGKSIRSASTQEAPVESS